MSPIPNKGFFDPPESIVHHEERAASIKAGDDMNRQDQAAIDAKQQADAEARRVADRAREDAELGRYAGLVQNQDARERLLDRIRQMREEAKPKEIVYPPLTPEQQAKLDKEQADGRAAVARAEEAQNAHRAKQEEAAKQNEATTVPVYRPNEMEAQAIPPQLRKK
jgi:hypothetical protein